MSHAISGYIADKDQLIASLSGYSALIIPLSCHNLAFVPRSDDIDRRLTRKFFTNLSFEVVEVFTDYFGGFGEQSARLTKEGKILFNKRGGFGPINQALRKIGVKRVGECDEFDTVGLDKHRSNEEWVESVAIDG